MASEHEQVKKKELDEGPKASFGYGGKFGVEKDRMDRVGYGGASSPDLQAHRGAETCDWLLTHVRFSRRPWATLTWRRWRSTPPRQTQHVGLGGSLACRRIASTK